MIKNPRTLLAIGHDITAIAVAWFLSYLLRFNLSIPEFYWAQMLNYLALVIPLQAIIFWNFNLYKGIWRYASLPDLKKIFFAVIIGAILIPMLSYMSLVSAIIPRSALILYPILLVLLMGGSRLTYRAWKEQRLYGLAKINAKPVLILGAGDAAASLIKDLSRSSEWVVAGILDDDPHHQNQMIHGVKVCGLITDLPRMAASMEIEHAIIAMPSASHGIRRQALEVCAKAGIKALTVPSFDDLISGKLLISQIRQVELDDLLGRDPVKLDTKGLHDFLTGKSVMVTGAGGSIGSELCRQIVAFSPSKLILFELNEYALYTVEQEFGDRFPDLAIACVIGDVKNAARIQQVIEKHKPQVLFHAAAYKHVPLMEDENAWEAIKNNVLGTYRLAKIAKDMGIEKLVLISTDKAVNPTNIMGASKRLAELVCQSLQERSGTRFVMVRFGNVLGSTGSVIPKFKEQIAKGGPITITHPEITRYFMSIPEAAQLVLQAGLMGKGGEIFVLDMGEPVKIVNLAKDLIQLSGFEEDDIKIVFTGLRPGEKLYEELLADDEHTLPTPHQKLRIAKARQTDEKWLSGLLDWISADETKPDEKVRQDLSAWVPEYTPTSRPH